MKKRILAFLFLAGGIAVFVFGNPYTHTFPTNGSVAYTLALTGLFLAGTLLCRTIPKLEVYWKAVYALLIAAAAMAWLNTGWLNLPRDGMPLIQDIAVDKVSQALHVIPVIVVFWLVSGQKLHELSVARGNLRAGLTFGLIWFVIFATAALLLNSRGTNLIPSLPKALPWIVLFVITNSLMEELWFRAIFLRTYEKLFGRGLAVVVTALAFGAPHIFATYDFPGGGYVFGAVVFAMGCVGAFAMLKDESIIGPVLFHAGYDLLIIVPVLASSLQ